MVLDPDRASNKTPPNTNIKNDTNNTNTTNNTDNQYNRRRCHQHTLQHQWLRYQPCTLVVHQSRVKLGCVPQLCLR